MKKATRTSCSLSEFMIREFSTASKSVVKKVIVHGAVRVNGKIITNPSVLLTPGDLVEYKRKSGIQSKIKPPCPILYEDNQILVAEKPAGLLTIGEKGEGGTSFYKILQAYIKEKSKGKERIFVVHRLDREVSGILIFAKSEETQEKLKRQWFGTRKLYYALVEGTPKEETGTIHSWLAQGKDQKVFSVNRKGDAKEAITKYRVMDKTEGYTLIEVDLVTGRKNQIRAHLSELGCPVVGDRRYGADATHKRRIRLHAFYLSLQHPGTGQWIDFKSRMPKSFLVLNAGDENYKPHPGR